MTRLLLLFALALAVAGPALAAPGQEPRQAPRRQTAKTDYWLSRDMQRLVFWQSRESQTQGATSSAR